MTRRRGILSPLLARASRSSSPRARGCRRAGRSTPGCEDDAKPAPPDFSFLPDRPQPGATPEQIVEGFIRAGSGPGRHRRLGASRASSSRPRSATTWDPDRRRDDRPARATASTPRPTEGSVVAVARRRSPRSTTNGAYAADRRRPEHRCRSGSRSRRTASGGSPRPSTGSCSTATSFPTVFHDYSVMYFDPTWQYLVPDVRWFPTVERGRPASRTRSSTSRRASGSRNPSSPRSPRA